MTTQIPEEDKEHVDKICKMGQGSACCRYLGMGENGFECFKTDAHTKMWIDGRVNRMTAKSDNCPGYGVKNA